MTPSAILLVAQAVSSEVGALSVLEASSGIEHSFHLEMADKVRRSALWIGVSLRSGVALWSTMACEPTTEPDPHKAPGLGAARTGHPRRSRDAA
jgi:hypothetical protein